MERFTLAPFAEPERHRAISEIVRSRSTNATDIREVALEGLSLRDVDEVIELGCGFGFMSQAIATRISPRGRIVGVDACSENEAPFLRAVGGAGRVAEFHHMRLDGALPWPRARFDLAVASYSLYFFPEIIPEVARVLSPAGAFVAITHSELSFARLCAAVGIAFHDTSVFRLVQRFSAENGERLLSPWFEDVRRIDYPNALCFERDRIEDLLEYARFKLPLLERPEAPVREDELRESLSRALDASGSLRIEKDDAVFITRSAKCR
jgi:SAM-dependent methyltransferase